MSLLDWLSDGLGLGGGPNGGTPMQPGPGSMVGGVDPMGSPNGQMGPMPTPAPNPNPNMPMPPVQQTGPDALPPVPPPGIEAMPGGQGGPAAPIDPLTQAMPGGQGGPAPAIPLPQARPPGAPGPVPGAPTDISANGGGVDLPGTMASYVKAGGDPLMRPPGEVDGGKGNSTSKGILESALGLSPDRATRVRGNLGAGLKSVAENAHKPGLAAFAGSLGSGIEGGTKSDEKQTDQRSKLLQQMITAQAAGDRATYTKALTEYTKAKLEAEKTKAANPEAAAKSRAAMTEEQKLFKINDALAKDPQVKAAQHLLESTKRTGSPKEVAAAQKSFDDLFKTKKTEITEALRPGSQVNPIKPTSPDDLKSAKPGDFFVNPADGKILRFKGLPKTPDKTADTAPDTGAQTPAKQAGLPSPGKVAAANPDDDEE